MAVGARGSKERIGKAAMAKANNITLSVEGVYEADRQKFQALAQDFGVTFDGNNNVVNNTIKDDVTLNTNHKDTIGNPHNTTIANIVGSTVYTGTVTVVTSVDFVGQTTTTQTITVTDGVITEVV